MALTRVAWIGRLTGPKGDVAYRIITRVTPYFPEIQFTVVGGPITERYTKAIPENVDLIGFVTSIDEVFKNNDLLIGAGRVAVEAMRFGLPVIAVGENRYIGPVDSNTIALAKSTNFGDCDHLTEWDEQQLIDDLKRLLEGPDTLPLELYAEFVADYNLEHVYSQVMDVYRVARIDAALRPFAEIPVLTYHRVLKAPPDGSKFNIYVTVDELESQIISLKRRGFEFVTFKDIANGARLKKPVILTFDDGYTDNYENLLPLLKKHNTKAVIYVLADRGLKNNLWDMGQGEQEASLMNDEQLLECHSTGLVEIGSHGMSHRHLPQLNENDALEEISVSKEKLEALLNDEIVSFAYPYGDYGEREAVLVKQAGYSFGIATVSGPVRMGSDLMRVRRISMFPNSGKSRFWRKTSGWYLRYCKLKGKDF